MKGGEDVPVENALLTKCKMYVRKFKKDVLDEEIQDLIYSAKADLKLSGVINQDEADPLIIRAITCYCKANFGYENKEAERFEKSYAMLKQHLSLCEEYNKVVVSNG